MLQVKLKNNLRIQLTIPTSIINKSCLLLYEGFDHNMRY